jgi:hypothetical protein
VVVYVAFAQAAGITDPSILCEAFRAFPQAVTFSVSGGPCNGDNNGSSWMIGPEAAENLQTTHLRPSLNCRVPIEFSWLTPPQANAQ